MSTNESISINCNEQNSNEQENAQRAPRQIAKSQSEGLEKSI